MLLCKGASRSLVNASGLTPRQEAQGDARNVYHLFETGMSLFFVDFYLSSGELSELATLYPYCKNYLPSLSRPSTVAPLVDSPSLQKRTAVIRKFSTMYALFSKKKSGFCDLFFPTVIWASYYIYSFSDPKKTMKEKPKKTKIRFILE